MLRLAVTCCLVFAFAAPARAEPKLGAMLGYNLGRLSRETEESFTAFGGQGHAGYQFSGFYAHGFFETMSLSYTAGEDTYDGLYSVSGVGLGYERYTNDTTRTGKVGVMLQVPLSSAYVVVSESAGTVNGASYIHSSLTTLSGGSGAQALFGYEVLVVGRGGKSKASENLYYGIYLGYLSHTFAKQTTRIKTNNSELAPISPGEEDVSYKLTVTSLNLTVAYDL